MTTSIKPIRILLVEDHAVVRMGFRLLLDSTTDLQVVAESNSGEEALQKFAEISPDLTLLDLNMGGMGGLETLSRLLAKDSSIKVLILSVHDDKTHPRRAIAAGARGYLCKRSAAETLIEAIHHVMAGKIYLEPQLAQEIALEQISKLKTGNNPESLSSREFDVFLMLARGVSVNEIAEALFLSPRTVGTHLYNIKQKLGANNAAELTLIAIRHGLIVV